MAKSRKTILLKSILRMFFPVLKMCLKNAVRYQELTENLKLGFIKAAQLELETKNKKVSVSKISAMTGINRREVSRLLENDFSLVEIKDVATRVIGQWQSDAKYSKAGKPRDLTAEGTNSEFFQLVTEISADLAPYTILYELERLNIIERVDDKIRLNMGIYAPDAQFEEGFSMLGEDIADLISSVQDNVFSDHPIANLHLKTEYNKIPKDKADEIRKWILIEGSAFHKKVRNYLSDFDLDINPRIGNETTDCTRISYCSFSYAEQEQDES